MEENGAGRPGGPRAEFIKTRHAGILDDDIYEGGEVPHLWNRLLPRGVIIRQRFSMIPGFGLLHSDFCARQRLSPP